MSEEEEEEEEEEESEEELLALSRDGWVCGSAAGFSATGNKSRQSGSCGHVQTLKAESKFVRMNLSTSIKTFPDAH